MSKHLAVVFWNTDDLYLSRAAFSLHVLENRLKAEDLEQDKGISIRDLFRTHGITVEQYRDAFPGGVIVDDSEGDKPLSWDSKFFFLGFPDDSKEAMSRLAALIKMPVLVFQFRRSMHDTAPRFQYRVG